MANQQTKEFAPLVPMFIDSTYKSLEDKNFNFFKDFTNYVDDFIAIQPGIEGFSEIDNENATMSIEERDEIEAVIYASMPNVPETDRYDITKAISGVLAGFRLGWRKGQERGTRNLIKDLKEGKVSIVEL